MDTEDLVTVQEAARYLGVAEVTVRAAIQRGALPHVPKFGRKLIERTVLEEWKRRTQPDGEPRVGRRPRKPTEEATE